MKDLKEYIESGILELYVLGELSQYERSEVEAMLDKYPELKNELNDIELALQVYAEGHAIEPKERIRKNVLASLNFNEDDIAAVKELPSVKPPNTGAFYKYAFAASIALLLLSVAALVYLNNKLAESRQIIAQLENSNQKIASRAGYIEKELSAAQEALTVFRNPEEYKLVELKGTSKAPDAEMIVAFSSAKEAVVIDLASLKMPKTDKQHQYQLWALVDGKPVDLGVFDTNAGQRGMMKMKSVKNAQAFAVTLEPYGGSAAPTLSQMMAMGEI